VRDSGKPDTSRSRPGGRPTRSFRRGTRPALAAVTGLDVRGQPVTVTGTGLLARCLQHEVDHLDGIVYIDRLPDHEPAAILAAAQDGTVS